MARIPDEDLARLKQDIPLVRLLERQGVTLKKAGADYLAPCPFHDDREPSLVISPKKNLFHCFGCGAAGSPIDWLMKTEGLSFRHAVEKLRTELPHLAAQERAVPPAAAKVELSLTEQAEDQELLNQVVDFYHATLKDSPEALEYLERRGLNDAELIDTFKLGFANRTLGYRLPVRKNAADGGIRSRLQRIGLLRDSGHEHFTGSVVVPVFDEHDHVVEMYGRKICDRLRKGTPKHLYLPGPHRGLWNVHALAASDELILCEALIDAMTFWVNGYRHVTAAYGTNGFTDEHLERIKQSGIRRVYIAYDRDKAGDAATEPLAKRLIAENIECRRLQLPKGMDVNAYACRVTPAARSLGVLLDSADWLGGAPAVENSPARERFTEQLKQVAQQLNHPDTGAAPSDARPLTSDSVPNEAATTDATDSNDPGTAGHADVNTAEVTFNFGDRHYRVRGLEKNNSLDQMKINLRVMRGDIFYIDTFELYAARARDQYIRQAAKELTVEEDVIKRDLGKLLRELEALQDQQINKALKPQPKTVELTAAETDEALQLLKAPDLMNRIVRDIKHAGLVGEDTNALMGYLCCLSRKLDKPLAMLIQSTSAAGKSALMDAVLAMMPDEDTTHYSAMTGQSLYYMSGKDLKHRILAVAEEEGASQAAYALKLLQSEGELSIASTGKDPTTGNLETQEYHVEGPVMLCLTTTAIDIDEELLNRCIVLTVNEDRQQTQAIHQLQRERRTLDGLLQKHQADKLVKQHQNAQRLLKPLAVVNPYAQHLTFIDDRTRTRRDHEKYLTLIDTIALLHQYQREIKTVTDGGEVIEYVEVHLSDIELANRLAHEILGRTLDELPPQTRTLLNLLREMVDKAIKEQDIEQRDYRFSRRDVREWCAWSDTPLKVHLARLVDMEYLAVHRSGQRFYYELLYDGDGRNDRPHLNGLIDTDRLKADYDANRSGSDARRSGSGPGAVGPRSGGGRDQKNRTTARPDAPLAASAPAPTKNTVLS